ncbi:MAG: hypothetical protein GYA17_08525 [Chloroflexi bacterium]|nr:hypothetical protein [Chloroflexota bacterium]
MIANEVGQNPLPPTSVSNASPANPATPQNQENILILHVDDLTSQTPRLVSVWMAVVSYSDPSVIFFKSLYPRPVGDQGVIPFDQFFSLDGGRHLSANFVSNAQAYNIHWNGYFLIDQYAISSMYAYALGSSIDLFNEPATTPDQIQIVISKETGLLQAACNSIPTIANNNRVFHWSEFIPRHFRTQYSFEDLVFNWDRLISANNSPHCEVAP